MLYGRFTPANREPSTGRFLPKDWPKGLFYVPISKNLLAKMESDVWADVAKISVEKHLSGRDFKKAVRYHKQGILPDRVPDRFKQKYIN
ncbi:unnamed protein product [Allacma fusca]|uniref:Uncharacterized protein n=1 Tax=Allacma fusca TaxID=39272 RepID=A0A8J2JLN3_9HEXA|nr:unnamed protein product [Allacma fusca]